MGWLHDNILREREGEEGKKGDDDFTRTGRSPRRLANANAVDVASRGCQRPFFSSNIEERPKVR
jgi:hypothetical protein